MKEEIPIFHVKTDAGEILNLILADDAEKFVNMKKNKELSEGKIEEISLEEARERDYEKKEYIG